jgi:5-oxoprolinase (ATP-hydrolysing) subunit C
MIEIIATTGLDTAQDLGRYGGLRYGIGRAGAMDRLALAAANLLFGNDEGAAGIEVPAFPFTARITADCGFAITGADCAARLDGHALLPWSAYRARAGQELVLGFPQGALSRTSRAYLALPGGIDVPEVLGSRSTQLRGAFGGLEGHFLEAGDHLRAAAAEPGETAAGFGLMPPSVALPLQAGDLSAVRIVPGVIQVPSGGQPIIQMSDAQPSGGYPKIGAVIEADLWRLGQAPTGSRIHFVQTTWEEAVAADEAVRAWLAEASRLTRLQRAQLLAAGG